MSSSILPVGGDPSAQESAFKLTVPGLEEHLEAVDHADNELARSDEVVRDNIRRESPDGRTRKFIYTELNIGLPYCRFSHRKCSLESACPYLRNYLRCVSTCFSVALNHSSTSFFGFLLSFLPLASLIRSTSFSGFLSSFLPIANIIPSGENAKD